MKRLFLFLFLVSALAATAQEKRDTAPYLKFPKLPAFMLLMPDSGEVFNTYYIPEGKPTVLIFFSPDCEHCQQTAKSIVAKKDSLKEVQFYFFTPARLQLLKSFVADTKLMELNHIKVGKDYDTFFPVYYSTQYVPFIAVYNAQKRFVRKWEGRMKMEEFMEQMTSMQATLKDAKKQ